MIIYCGTLNHQIIILNPLENHQLSKKKNGIQWIQCQEIEKRVSQELF